MPAEVVMTDGVDASPASMAQAASVCDCLLLSLPLHACFSIACAWSFQSKWMASTMSKVYSSACLRSGPLDSPWEWLLSHTWACSLCSGKVHEICHDFLIGKPFPSRTPSIQPSQRVGTRLYLATNFLTISHDQYSQFLGNSNANAWIFVSDHPAKRLK